MAQLVAWTKCPQKDLGLVAEWRQERKQGVPIREAGEQ